MADAYTSDGRRKSSITHSTRSHKCTFCDRTVFGNGGKVSHARGHVKRGEAVELIKEYPYPMSTMRVFLAPGDPQTEKFVAMGFSGGEHRG